MKYWLLTTEYPPFFGGGISTYCQLTARMLAAQGHNITVFVNDSNVPDVTVSNIDGIRVVRFSPYRTGAAGFLGHTTNVSYEFAQVIKLFIEKEGRPDLIEAQEYLGIAYYLLQYKYLEYDWCSKIPVVITMHSPSFLYMRYNHISEHKYPNYWICEMERFCLQAADLLISPSRYILKELEQYFDLTQKSIRVIPNPFESSFTTEPDTSSDNGQIIFYGKLTAQKGAFRLLAYFDELWRKGFSEPLYLVGGQDIVYHPEGVTMGDWIRKRYKEYIDKGLLRMEDRVQPSRIAERLSGAKLVILPSTNDNLPYVVFEMMALGNVVLVSRQGGQSEIVEDGVDGFVFDHTEQGSFESRLRTILQLSPEDRRRIRVNAVQKVKSGYALPVIYQKKAAALEAVLSEESPAVQFPFIRQQAVRKCTVENQLLSVVVPYYNMGRYIEETIKSIRGSDYPYKEIIIVNDGSTDEQSLQKLVELEKEGDIKVVHSSNQGLAKTRNLGASQAAGGYLAFLDADDRVSPDYYSRAVKVLARYENVHFAGCWTQYFEGSESVWPGFAPEPPLILYQNTVNSSALVYKKQAFLEGGTNDGGMVFQGWEDYESVIGLVASGYGGVVLPETLFHYRVRRDSMIRAISRNKKLYLYEHISTKHRSIYSNFAHEIISLLQANGPAYGIDNPTLDYTTYSGNPLMNKIIRKSITIIKNNPALKRAALSIYRKFKS